MIFSQLRSYNVNYLLTYRADANAPEDGGCPGHYHHTAMLIGENENEIVRQIIDLGGIPVKVKVLKERNSLFSKITNDYKQQFLRSIYFNCTKLSAAKALEAVMESESGSIRAQFNPALAIIKRGGTFTEAIEALGFFDESTLAILDSGERTGSLPESINTAVEHLKSSAMTIKLMLGMGSVAMFEVFMALSSMLGNRYGMLPRMAKEVPPDLPPEKLEALKSAIYYAYLTNDIMIWLTFGVLFVGIMAAYSYFDKTKSFRKWIDDRVQRIPALGVAIQQTATTSSFRVAGSLLKGGVHLAVAMSIAQKSTRVPSVMNYWEVARKRGENGESVASMLKQPLLDNSNQLLISAHANSKQLAETFFVISERSDEMAKKSAKKFGWVLMVALVGYTTLAVCMSLYVMWIQNESMLSGMKNGV